VPSQNYGESRPYACGAEFLHLFSDLGLYLSGYFITVKDGGSHSIHGNKYLNHKKCKGTPAQIAAAM
jgi:hypothetical protein